MFWHKDGDGGNEGDGDVSCDGLALVRDVPPLLDVLGEGDSDESAHINPSMASPSSTGYGVLATVTRARCNLAQKNMR